MSKVLRNTFFSICCLGVIFLIIVTNSGITSPLTLKPIFQGENIRVTNYEFKVEKGESPSSPMLKWKATLENRSNYTMKFDIKVSVLLENGRVAPENAHVKGAKLDKGQSDNFSGQIKISQETSENCESIKVEIQNAKQTI